MKKGKGMRIKVVYRNGKFEPLERVDLPEGAQLLIAVEEGPRVPPEERFRKAAGSWKGLVDTEALKRNIYRSRLVPSKRFGEK